MGIQDLAWLLRQLEEVTPKWFLFGVQLNIQHSRLEVFEKTNPDYDDCLRKTLACWLKRNPTAGQLLKALNAIGLVRVSRDLKQSFSRGDHKRG